MKGGRKEGRKGGRKEGRKEGREEGRKDGTCFSLIIFLSMILQANVFCKEGRKEGDEGRKVTEEGSG